MHFRQNFDEYKTLDYEGNRSFEPFINKSIPFWTRSVLVVGEAVQELLKLAGLELSNQIQAAKNDS